METILSKFSLAINNNDLDKVKRILDEYPAIVNSKKILPLYYASRKGHLEIVKLLIKYGANTGVISDYKYDDTPVSTALTHFHYDVAEYLIRHGADIDHGYYYYSPLDFVLRVYNSPKREKFAKLLIEAGANLNNPLTDDGLIPLSSLSKEGDIELVKILLDNGADINAIGDGQYDETALYYASMEGQLEIIKLLLKHGAKIDKSQKDGATPLWVACREGQIEAVKLLLAHGANVNAECLGETCLYQALFGLKGGLSYSKNEKTELMEKKYNEIIRLLLDHHADVNKGRLKPLVFASSIGNYKSHIGNLEKIIKLLLAHGADVNIQSDYIKNTPLIEAQNIEVLKILLDNGADINKSNNYGDTPLHYASKAGDIERVKFLLIHGADVNIVNKSGFTPLDIASEKEHLEIVEILSNLQPFQLSDKDVPAYCYDPNMSNNKVNIKSTNNTIFYILNEEKKIVKSICVDSKNLKLIKTDNNNLFYRQISGKKEYIRRINFGNSYIYYIKEKYSKLLIPGNKYILFPSENVGQLYKISHLSWVLGKKGINIDKSTKLYNVFEANMTKRNHHKNSRNTKRQSKSLLKRHTRKS